MTFQVQKFLYGGKETSYPELSEQFGFQLGDPVFNQIWSNLLAKDLLTPVGEAASVAPPPDPVKTELPKPGASVPTQSMLSMTRDLAQIVNSTFDFVVFKCGTPVVKAGVLLATHAVGSTGRVGLHTSAALIAGVAREVDQYKNAYKTDAEILAARKAFSDIGDGVKKIFSRA